ncbi:uncharacterized protein LOC107654025 [Sinocyclocheilus anshuiensis]|uniref:uncharacterized protein LOC107654025 n=1 Tax=Sinocyclocheilus anshuiensis TaxID=1608454 RepID=UPI0007B7A980|nr:PREDICTED: uncharacterized protein LOC107654025 [Sinocyclocheilus anshuiensis]
MLVVPAVVITSMDVNKIPVELTEDVVSAEVVPRIVLSIEVMPRVVVSAEVVPRVVLSTEVVVVSAEVVPRVVLSAEVMPRLVVSADVVLSTEVVVVSAEVMPRLVVSSAVVARVLVSVVVLAIAVSTANVTAGVGSGEIVAPAVVITGVYVLLDESVLWLVLRVFSNSPHGTVGLTSKSERSKSVPNSTSASTTGVAVLVILSGCVAALEDSPSLVVPSVIVGGLKGSVFVHEVGCGYLGVLDGSVLWVVLGISSNSPHGTVGLTSKSGRSKSVPTVGIESYSQIKSKGSCLRFLMAFLNVC